MEDKELYLRTLAAMYVDGYLTDEDEVLAEDLLEESTLFRDYVSEYKEQLRIELVQLDQEREELIANIRDSIAAVREPKQARIQLTSKQKRFIAASFTLFFLVGAIFYLQKQHYKKELSMTIAKMQDSLQMVNAQNQELVQKLTMQNSSVDTKTSKIDSLQQNQQSQLSHLVAPGNFSSSVTDAIGLPNIVVPDNQSITRHVIDINFHPNSGDSRGVTSNENQNARARTVRLTINIRSSTDNDLGTFSIDTRDNFTLNISTEMYNRMLNQRIDIYKKDNNDYEISINGLRSYLLDINDNKIYSN